MISRRAGRLRHGRVVDFDDSAGYGNLTGTGADGETRSWSFHCSAITDGSRTIAVGTEVEFHLVLGHLGRREARDITAV